MEVTKTDGLWFKNKKESVIFLLEDKSMISGAEQDSTGGNLATLTDIKHLPSPALKNEAPHIGG